MCAIPATAFCYSPVCTLMSCSHVFMPAVLEAMCVGTYKRVGRVCTCTRCDHHKEMLLLHASIKCVLTRRRTRAVAFRIYDLDDTGSINQGEVQRLLAALLADNPALDLDEGAIQKIVQQARPPVWGCVPCGRGLALGH